MPIAARGQRLRDRAGRAPRTSASRTPAPAPRPRPSRCAAPMHVCAVLVERATAAACVEVSARNEDRRVGRVHLLVGRRHDVLRQLAQRLRDRRLHVLRGGVDVAVERELERDLGAALAAATRSSRRGRRWSRTASRAASPPTTAIVSGLAPGRLARHRDRRDSRRSAGRSPAAAVGHEPEHQDPGHDQRGHDRPPDERFAEVHGGTSRACCTCTLAPSVRRSWPSVTTGLPALTPAVRTAIESLCRRTVHRAHVRRARVHHVDVAALLAGHDRARRHHDRRLVHREVEPHPHERAGPEPAVPVGELAP